MRMHTSRLYDEFEKLSHEVHNEIMRRNTIEYDDECEYTLSDTANAAGLISGSDLERAYKINSRLASMNLAFFGRPYSQSEINMIYRCIQEMVVEERSCHPFFEISDINKAASLPRKLDEYICRYLNRRFILFKSPYADMHLSEDMGKGGLLLLIDTSYLRIEHFFGASLVSCLDILREVCDISKSILTRSILARSLFEAALHQLFFMRRLLEICERSRTSDLDVCYSEFLAFNELFNRGMYGTSSNSIGPTESRYQPYPKKEMIKCVGADESPFDRASLNSLYWHLCDYTHPNSGMRSLSYELENSPGDPYSDQVRFALEGEHSFRAISNNNTVVRSVEVVYWMISRASIEKEAARVTMHEMKARLLRDGRDDSDRVTGHPRPVLQWS